MEVNSSDILGSVSLVNLLSPTLRHEDGQRIYMRMDEGKARHL